MVVFGELFPSPYHTQSNQEWTIDLALWALVLNAFMVFIGSVMTKGIPYLMGIVVSLLFVEPKLRSGAKLKNHS